MRIGPLLALRRSRAPRDAAFTGDSDLRGIVLRMISTNALGAFTQEIVRRPPVDSVRGITPAAPSAAGTGSGSGAEMLPPQRPLEAMPAQPTRPLPRGSLLDLRL